MKYLQKIPNFNFHKTEKPICVQKHPPKELVSFLRASENHAPCKLDPYPDFYKTSNLCNIGYIPNKRYSLPSAVSKPSNNEKHGFCRPPDQNRAGNHLCCTVFCQCGHRHPWTGVAGSGRCICAHQFGEFLSALYLVWHSYLPQARTVSLSFQSEKAPTAAENDRCPPLQTQLPEGPFWQNCGPLLHCPI